MTAIRQDAWTDEDDLILAEVTLKHIREGSTQLAAFEEVGERIGRTSAACGFRWNSFVRKKHETAIQIAKSQRQKRGQQKKQIGYTLHHTGETEPITRSEQLMDELSIETVIRFLRQWKSNYQEMSRHVRQLEKELSEKQEEIERLRLENDSLSKQATEAFTDYRTVNDDYRALIQIMDRARKLAFLGEEEEENRVRFKMDENGNLERIE